MINQVTNVITKTNNLINDHKIASSIIAGSLLASTAFVSAAAISGSALSAKDAYSFPVASGAVNSSVQTGEEKPAEAATNQTQPGSASAPASNTTMGRQALTSGTKKTATASSAKPSASTSQPTQNTAEQPATDEQPGYTIVFRKDQQSTYHDIPRNASVALLPFDVVRQPGHTTKLSMTAGIIYGPGNQPLQYYNVICEISTKAGEDDMIGSVRIVAYEHGSPAGVYGCAYTISDGTTVYEGVFEAELAD